MNTQQQIVLWVGLLLTLIYLFTDKTFHAALTTSSAGAGTVQDVDFTSASPASQASAAAGAQLD